MRLPTRSPSDRPQLSVRLLFALEAGATVVVVSLILTAIAIVGLHQPAIDPRDPPTAAALPATPIPEVPADSDGTSPSVTPGGDPAGAPSPGPSPAAVGPGPAAPLSTTHRRQSAPTPGAPHTYRPPDAPSPTHQAHCLRASHVLNTQWPGGLQAQFTVTNCGTTAVNGWVVTVGFSGAVSIQAWNALANGGSSSVDFGAVDYDSLIQPGASATFGFNAVWSNGGSRYITGCAVGYGRCS